jgi:hypothetical protein
VIKVTEFALGIPAFDPSRAHTQVGGAHRLISHSEPDQNAEVPANIVIEYHRIVILPELLGIYFSFQYLM